MTERKSETQIGGPGGQFRSTRWSIVLSARDLQAPGRDEALKILIETYWKPLFFFIRRKGNDVESSKDLTQGFFVALLEKDYLKYVDAGRGRFRTFLLTALDHYVRDEIDRARAQKRGGGRPELSLDFSRLDPEGFPAARLGETPEDLFTREWAIQVMAQGIHQVRQEFEASGRLVEFDTYQQHLASTHPKESSYEEISKALGISVETVRNRIRNTRQRVREAILEVIRSYTASPEEAKDEYHDLRAALSNTSPGNIRS